MTKSLPRKARLLMIEDNPGDVGLFRWALERADLDCELSVIGDGGAALDFVRQRSGTPDSDVPDLVILDLNLPKASGKEILAAMRATAPFVNVPVVIWTSSNAPSDRAQLDALRVNRYVVKPLELSEFLTIGTSIREVLDQVCDKDDE